MPLINDIFANMQNRINAILDKQEVLESDINFSAILGEAIKDYFIVNNLLKRKEVGRDTFRDIPGKMVLYKDNSQRKIKAGEIK